MHKTEEKPFKNKSGHGFVISFMTAEIQKEAMRYGMVLCRKQWEAKKKSRNVKERDFSDATRQESCFLFVKE
jgi:hypothetical protein